jgi:N-acetylglucosaminyldiphosphoundecaprenol N-acetyl-beta-D-mannosaminyltransferase
MRDDLDREVYGILGIPVDRLDMAAMLQKITTAVGQDAPLFISTVNLNFLVNSLGHAGFRESLQFSDVCSADGMPIVWIARIMGIPIRERIAGSDIVDALKSGRGARPIKIFLFGGGPDVAARACARINAEVNGLHCVGSLYPGFGSIETMSEDALLDAVNASHADFLAVALGAEKGQAWLLRNHARLQIPVRAHLGATINFQAGTVARAPRLMQRLGLEWLWRIREEPALWRRYWRDFRILMQLTITRIAPMVVLTRWHALRCRGERHPLLIERKDGPNAVFLRLQGVAGAEHIKTAISHFRSAAAANKPVVINFTDTELIDPRFLGLLLMLDKRLKGRGLTLTFASVPPRIMRLFRLNGFGFLLERAMKA